MMKTAESPAAFLARSGDADDKQLISILCGLGPDEELFAAADRIRRRVYGNAVYLRGLIEISNYCINDCYYCGIRKSNINLDRYRLEKEVILNCCENGHALGFRTFVLQGGEDPSYRDDVLVDIVKAIHESFPDCAITLSLGERSEDSYKQLFEAGARRYLLRHEAASKELYRKLHPREMSLEHRKDCLRKLKEIGFQTGAGFMVGAPGQKMEHLVEDLRFLQELKPDMVGIGPFMHHVDTPFGDRPDGSMELTLRLLAVIRIMLPWALLPATTALASIDPKGREKGLQAGANVIMPNLSPLECRDKYSIYNNKAATGLESAQAVKALKEMVEKSGYRIDPGMGNVRR